MGPIPNYDLGSVQGEVRISYDRQGISDAREDINEYLGDVDRLREALRRYDESQQSSSQNASNFGQRVRDAESGVEALGASLRSISKIPVLLGAAQEVIAFGAAVAPAVGITAVLPAVLGAVVTAGAAVKIGMTGMGDAMSAVAEGDAAKLQEAMAKLSPEAREVVLAVRDIKPAWDALRMDVQNRLMEGMGYAVRDLAEEYLPTLHRGLGGMATQLNVVATQSANALMDGPTVANLAVLMDNASAATGNFGSALGDVLAGLINMGGAGSQWLPIWTYGVSDLTTRFREWTASAEGQAQVNEWIQQGANVIGELVKLVINLGSIFSGVFKAMETGSGGALTNLVALTGQMAAWVNSAEGQATLIPIFQLLHLVMVALVDIITIILTVLGSVASVITSLDPTTQNVIASFIAWAAVLGVLIGWLTPIISFITAMAGHIGTLITVLRALWTAFNLVITVFRIIGTLFLANPWLLLIVAVIALVAIIIYNWDTIKTYLAAAWLWIQTTAATVWGAIVAFFTGIWETIKAPIIAVWEFIKLYLTNAWNDIWTIFTLAAAILLALFFTIWNPLVAVVTTVWNAIVAFLTPILQTIQTAIATAWEAVSSTTTAVWNAVLGFLTTTWNAIWGVVGPIVQRVWDTIVNAWNVIRSTTQSVWNAISGVISSVWNTITGIFNGAVNTVMGVLNGLWNRISGLAGSAMNLLVNAGRNIVQGLWNGIQAMGSWLYNSIMGWIRSVVPGPILQFLGIASPSKWADKEVGRNLPPGIAQGIEHETPVAEDASRTMAEKVAAAAANVNLSSLPITMQHRVGALAGATGTVSASPSSAVAAASAPGAIAGSGRVINIGTLSLQVAGNLDPTDPVRWRKAIENLRTDLTTVEASYR